MKVQVVSYGEPGYYFWDDAGSKIGAKGVEATIECGYLTDDAWQQAAFTVETRTTATQIVHYIHVIIPENGPQALPEQCYVALVQQLTSDVVALTPLHVPTGSALKEWQTTYHQRGE